MNQQQPQPPNMMQDAQSMLGWLMLLCCSYSTAMEVFLHRNMGERYLHFQAVGVLLLVPLHTLFLKTRDPSLTAWFLLFYLLACFAQRCNMWARRKRGQFEHSQYNGFPLLMGPKATISEHATKTWVEPLLVAVFGWLMTHADQAFGSFIITCGAAMCLKNLMGRQLREAETTDMRDSLIEQQQRANRFRESTSSDRTQWR